MKKRKRFKNGESAGDADEVDTVKNDADDQAFTKKSGAPDDKRSLDDRRRSNYVYESSSDDNDSQCGVKGKRGSKVRNAEESLSKKTDDDDDKGAPGETAAPSSSKRRCTTVDEAELTLEKVRLEEEEDEPSTKAPSKGDESTLATVTKDDSTPNGDGTGANRKHQILRSSSSSSSGTSREKTGNNEVSSSDRGSTAGDDTIGVNKARASSFSDPRSAKRRCADPVDESLDLDKVKLSESGAVGVGPTPTDANKKKRTTAASNIEVCGKSAKTPEEIANKKRPAIAEERDLDRKKRAATSGATCGDDATVVNIDKVRLVDADPAHKKKKCASVVEDEDDDTSLDLGKVRLDDENPPTSTGRGRGSDDEGEAPSRKKKRKESHGGHNDEEEAYKEAISATDDGPEDDNGDAAAAATAEEEEEGIRDGDDNDNDVASGNISTQDAEAESESEDKSSPNKSDDGGGPDGETIDGPIKSKKVKHEPTQEEEEGVQDDEIDLESKAYRQAITSADEADDEAVEPNDAEKKDD